MEAYFFKSANELVDAVQACNDDMHEAGNTTMINRNTDVFDKANKALNRLAGIALSVMTVDHEILEEIIALDITCNSAVPFNIWECCDEGHYEKEYGNDQLPAVHTTCEQLANSDDQDECESEYWFYASKFPMVERAGQLAAQCINKRNKPRRGIKRMLLDGVPREITRKTMHGRVPVVKV